MSYIKRNLLALFLFLSFPIFTDINKNPFELIDAKSQEMVVVLTTENELFNTNPELFKDKIKNIFEPLIDFNRVSASVMGKKYF
jgi:ABC-type transport system involved in resistance to organic solvents, auxiliary component